jgi:hypothetical protein
VRVSRRCQSGAGEVARREGASCGRARLDPVDDKEMVQPLDGVHDELC